MKELKQLFVRFTEVFGLNTNPDLGAYCKLYQSGNCYSVIIIIDNRHENVPGFTEGLKTAKEMKQYLLGALAAHNYMRTC